MTQSGILHIPFMVYTTPSVDRLRKITSSDTRDPTLLQMKGATLISICVCLFTLFYILFEEAPRLTQKQIQKLGKKIEFYY